MHPCRVYFPMSATQLSTLAQVGEVTVTRLHTVTEALERGHPSEDEEGLEYLALQAACAQALASRSARTPVVVAAADLPSDTLVVGRPERGEPPSEATAGAPVTRRQVVSFHVEEPAAATSAWQGRPDLLWYDVTELDEVVRLAT